MADEAALFALAPKRVHDAEGPGRRGFAFWQAARHGGALIWCKRLMQW